MADDDTFGRRQFVQWASAIGLGSIVPGTVSDVAEAMDRENGRKNRIPDERRGDPASDVQIHHPLERNHVRERVERAGAGSETDAARNAAEFENPGLRRQIEAGTDEEVDLVVTTMGQGARVRGEGPHRRRIDGWRATDDEVAQLSEYGTVEYVNDILAARVRLSGVSVDDVDDVARLPTVLRVAPQPTPEPGSYPDADQVRNQNWFEFDGNHSYSIGDQIRIAVIDSGYEGSGASEFAESHAEKIGIDTGRAADFTHEDDWSNPTDPDSTYHGDNVADMAAYMLDPTHQEGDQTFVPLKIASEYGWSGSAMAQAMEHCAQQGIQVFNISGGSVSPYSKCPETYCEEMQSYAQMGYIAVALTHNQGSENGVTDTATSRYSVSAGGVRSDSDGVERVGASNYGNVKYGESNRNAIATYCDTCYRPGDYDHAHVDREFNPTVYGAYGTQTPGSTLYGTSFATPQVAAAAAIMQSNYLYDFETAKDLFAEMDDQQVSPDLAARRGQLLDAREANERT